MRSAVSATLLLLSLSQHVVSSPHLADQAVLAPHATDEAISTFPTAHGEHVIDDSILAALQAHSDPVDALISLHPELAEQLSERRLIHVFGEADSQWMTEGDKLRLRRQGKKFRDITDHQELYTGSVDAQAGKASMPKHLRPLSRHSMLTQRLSRSPQAFAPKPDQASLPQGLHSTHARCPQTSHLLL